MAKTRQEILSARIRETNETMDRMYAELNALRASYKRLKMERAGVKIGDRIIVTIPPRWNAKEVKTMEVEVTDWNVGITPDAMGRPEGRKIKKDGTVSNLSAGLIREGQWRKKE